MSLRPKVLRAAPVSAMLALAGALAVSGCAEAPTGIPTADSVRGLKPSGAVVLNQITLAGTSLGTGTLSFRGQSYPFTILGTQIGPGAIAGLSANGTVYNLTDVSQFSGSYVQGTGRLALALSVTPIAGEIWLKNNHGVILRLQADQTGLSLTRGRAELLITLGR